MILIWQIAHNSPLLNLEALSQVILHQSSEEDSTRSPWDAGRPLLAPLFASRLETLDSACRKMDGLKRVIYQIKQIKVTIVHHIHLIFLGKMKFRKCCHLFCKNHYSRYCKSGSWVIITIIGLVIVVAINIVIIVAVIVIVIRWDRRHISGASAQNTNCLCVVRLNMVWQQI